MENQLPRLCFFKTIGLTKYRFLRKNIVRLELADFFLTREFDLTAILNRDSDPGKRVAVVVHMGDE